MNTKNNRRRRESIGRILSVFLQLLQTKELRQITVSDICKLSGLNRSTFYANFADVYDLADHLRAYLEDEIKGLYAAEWAEGFNSNDFLRLFRHMRENQLLYLAYFKLGYDTQHQIELYDVNQAQHFFDNRHIEHHIEFFRGGFNAVVKLWLAGGCKETPEELEEIIRSEYQGRLPTA